LQFLLSCIPFSLRGQKPVAGLLAKKISFALVTLEKKFGNKSASSDFPEERFEEVEPRIRPG